MKIKRLTLLLAFACFMTAFGYVAQAAERSGLSGLVRFMTFNIRHDNPDDGQNAWSNRRFSVTELVRFYQPDFLGVQEALYHQYNQMRQDLSEYTAFGVGRDDGLTRGEYSALFVRSDDFDVTDSGTFWLSRTPDVPSVGWDAAMPRIATWLRAKSTHDDNTFLVVNTHWDHRGSVAQRESAKLIRNWIATHKTEEDTVVLLGDLNVTPSTEPYRQVLSGEMLVDTKTFSELPPFGPSATFTEFDILRLDAEPIDYIFSTANVRVIRHGVITQHSGGALPSDHYPVMVDLIPNHR